MSKINNYMLDDLKNKFSNQKIFFSSCISQRVQLVLTRMELHNKTQIKLSKNLNGYTTNSKKIYIHLVRISSLWVIYESLFDLLKNVFMSNIFLSRTGKGKFVSGYLVEYIKNTAMNFSYSPRLVEFFEYIINQSCNFPHKDGLMYLNEITEYVNYLIRENERVSQITYNTSLNKIVEKMKFVTEVKKHNYNKSKNIKKLSDKQKTLEWEEMLGLIYSIRNHFFHNAHNGIESVITEKSEKFRLMFLVCLYTMFSEIVNNMFWNEMSSYITLIQNDSK